MRMLRWTVLLSSVASAACGSPARIDDPDEPAGLPQDAADAAAVIPAAPCRAVIDASFGRGGTLHTADEDEPTAIAVQPDGKIVTGFGRLARFLPDWTPDPTFQLPPDPNQDFAASSIALAPDGKIVAGFAGFVRRFRSDGSLDESFGNHGIAEQVLALPGDPTTRVAVLSDGSVLGVGSDNPSSGGGGFVIIRWDASGHIDRAFGNGSIYGDGVTRLGAYQLGAQVSGLEVQGDGRILVAGVARTVSADNQWVLTPVVLRVTAAGQLDPSFGSSGMVTTPLAPGGNAVSALRLDRDGAILVVESADVGPSNAIVDADTELLFGRYSADGVLDARFGNHGVARIGPPLVRRTGVLPMIGPWAGGGYVVVSTWGTDFTFGGFVVAGFTHDGAPDPRVGGNGLLPSLPMDNIPQTAAIASDGALLILGTGQPQRVLEVTRVSCQ